MEPVTPTLTMLALAAAGWLFAAVAMAALWRWHLHLRKAGLAEAAVPLVTGALAVMYANAGDGASVHGSAIAWMIGSWGARLGVYLLWDEVFERAATLDARESLATFEWRAGEAVFFAIPALLASFNRTATLSTVELAAAAVWLVAFAGETTADRQLVRWRRERAAVAVAAPESAPEGVEVIDDRVCRAGLWRYVPYAHEVFELLTWTAHAAFAWSSPFGWLAAACPIAVAYRLATAGTRRAQLW
jgi:steroid 5-alpha reductase family enzyme